MAKEGYQQDRGTTLQGVMITDHSSIVNRVVEEIIARANHFHPYQMYIISEWSNGYGCLVLIRNPKASGT